MDIRNTLNRFKESLYFFDLLVPHMKPAKAYMNWLRANYEMLRQVDTVKAKPLKLTIEPTNLCQLRCPLCPTGLRINDRDFCNLKMDVFKHLIDEVGDYVFFVDFFNWGEAFLNSQLEEYLRILHSRNISTTLSTNLSVKISDERIEKLINSGINHIVVSLDGASKESYTTYRRGGDFDLVMDNLQRIVKIRNQIGSKTPYVTWQFLIFSFNEFELDKAQNIARDIGVDSICFRKAYIDEGHYEIPDNDRSLIRQWIPSNPLYTYYDSEDKEKHFSIPLKVIHKFRKKRCDWLYVSSVVNADGTISPCCAIYQKSNDLGSLDLSHEHSFMTEFNNNSFKEIRNGIAGRCVIPKDVACAQCSNGSLMEYAKGINRWIAFTAVVRLLYAIALPFKYIFNKRQRIVRPSVRIKWPD